MQELKAMTRTDIRELKKLFSGKVRDIYEVENDQWLIVTTDRLSAFDVVFAEGIPDKGRVLNRISNRWFSKITSIDNHLISTTPQNELPFLAAYEGIAERSVLVKKLKRIPMECVVRGYLFGSVYEEYKKSGTAGGVKLPSGISLAGELPEPVFTPSTKAEKGHDENINHERFMNEVGKELGEKIMKASTHIFTTAREIMEKYGIILADTKFEFGLDEDGNLVLVDEVLTPDSSRYWELTTYRVGESPASYDKQFVRDYLDGTKWNKQPPAPALPYDVILKTREKYLQILDVIEKI
jgi:phosphoribosylaminoimidazole-succinocarboxamide synthase